MPTTTNTVAGGFGFAVLNDLESLLKDSKNADVEIKVYEGAGEEGVGFRCHKAILAVRSPVFRAMFESDMKETHENVVNVYDILPKTIGHFLSFLYCGRFQDSSWIGSLPKLVYVSDKVATTDRTGETIVDNIPMSATLENAVTLVKLAERHGLAIAAGDIRNFIGENVHEVNLDTDLDTSNSNPNFKVVYSYRTPPHQLIKI